MAAVQNEPLVTSELLSMLYSYFHIEHTTDSVPQKPSRFKRKERVDLVDAMLDNATVEDLKQLRTQKSDIASNTVYVASAKYSKKN